VVTRILVGVAAASLATSFAAVAAGAGGSTAPPTGDPAGLALLARIHRAYADVRGVTLSGRAGSLSFRFTLGLRSGVVESEQIALSGPNGTSTFVARRGTPTFARDPGRSCWRRIPSSSDQAIENIGVPFPDQPKMRVRPPRRTRTGWLLPVVGVGGPATFAVDRESLLIRSLTLTTQGMRIVEHARALKSRPAPAVPEPRC
jgi:hypothetical protein